MKNKLADLNNHLFAQLERLSDEDLPPEKLALECDRADAIVGISEQLIKSANVRLRAAELMGEHGGAVIGGDLLGGSPVLIEHEK